MNKLAFRPALLVIDMQNDFADPASRLYCSGARALIPRINQLAVTARGNGAPVIWVVQEHRHQLVDFGREIDISPVHCVEGTPGAALIGGLCREGGDYTVIKRRYSGFYLTDLELLLRCLSCSTVVLAGLATDGCVKATAVDAQARDFYVRVVSDATASFNDAAHDAALQMLSCMQPGVVITTAEAARQLASGDK